MFKNKMQLMIVMGLVIAMIASGCAAAATPSALASAQTNGAADNTGKAIGSTSQASTGSRTITVVGVGSASGMPDIATAQIGVDTQGASPEQVTRTNSDQLTAVIKALKAAGIDEKDIQTSYYNVYSEQRFKPETGQSTGEYVYHASSSLNVTIRDLSKVGAALTTAIAAGANNVSGVSFSVADSSKLEAAAREKAVNDARARAADLARLFNAQVGNVVTISEVINGGPLPVYARSAAAGLGGGGAPIQPGQLSVSSQLQVTFEIK